MLHVACFNHCRSTEIIIAIDEVRFTIWCGCHHDWLLFHYNDIFRHHIGRHVLRLKAERFAYIESANVSLFIDVEVKVCRELEMI